MKITTATLLLIISLLGILCTLFLYSLEIPHGKGGGYLCILGGFLLLGVQSFAWIEILFEKRKEGEIKKYDYLLINLIKLIFGIGAIQLLIQTYFK